MSKELAVQTQTSSALSIPPRELELLQAEINLILKSSLVPEAVRGKPAEMLTIALYGRALGLPLMASLQHVVVIKGRPFVETKAVGAILNERRINWMFEETTPTTCTVMGRHPNDPADWPLRKLTFTMDEAVKGGLTSNECYKKHPSDMLRYRTLGKWVRANCPEVMMGMASIGATLAESDLDQPFPTHDLDNVIVDAEVVDVAPYAPSERVTMLLDALAALDADQRAAAKQWCQAQGGRLVPRWLDDNPDAIERLEHAMATGHPLNVETTLRIDGEVQ